MPVRPIVHSPAAILRQKAEPVEQFDQQLHQLLDDMVETMQAAEGVGLAAPQVGVSQRVLIAESKKRGVIRIVNPVFVRQEGEQWEPLEGCLSIPDLLGRVQRAYTVIVTGQDSQGASIRIRAEGFLARILQHEVDHLDGILFPDRAQEVFSRRDVEA